MSTISTNRIDDTINILLIEDNPGDAKLVEIYLHDSSIIKYKLYNADRLHKGIALAQEHVFDIVLLDLSLPDSKGFETLTNAVESFPPITSIVVLTGHEDESLGVKAVKSGAQDYLIKGQIDTSSLTRAVLHGIERRKMHVRIEQVNENLKISEQRLLMAQHIAKIGNYELQLSDNRMYWSDVLYHIFDIKQGEVEPSWNAYLSSIPLCFRQKIRQKFQEVINDVNCNDISIEHKIESETSEHFKYVRNQCIIERDALGKATKLLGTIQDISKYKNAEDMLLQSQQRYKTIFDESQDAIYIISKENTKFAEYNESLLTTFGYTQKDIQQIEAQHLFEDKKKWLSLQKIVEAEGSVNYFAANLLKKDGTVLQCVLSSTLWKSLKGEVIGYHGIIRDVTTFQKTQELIRAKKVAEKSAQLKEQFLANMSHEIRTPMNVVVGMTHLLEATPLNQNQKEYIKSLKLSSNHLLRLINNILDFSRIESGKLELEQYPFSIKETISDLINTFKFIAKEKSISLFQQIDMNLPDKVVGDSHHLSQILHNLVSNALKFTNEGEINIKAKVIEETEDNIRIKFAIIDTGIGIAQEKQDTIFESFTQANNETTRFYGGTGLGLSIAKNLVDLFGGNIGLESELGKGSTFYFEIPFLKDKDTTNLQVSTNQPTITNLLPKNTTKKANTTLYTTDELDENDVLNPQVQPFLQRPINILMVEDHKLNQRVATDLLKKWSNNITLYIADNGQIAIDMLKAGNTTYDIILMDVSMPVKDGYDTTLYIRANFPEPTRSIPIIAMTAHAFKTLADRCFEVGMNEFVSKPIKPEVLYAKLNKMLTIVRKKNVLNKQTQVVYNNSGRVKVAANNKTTQTIDLSYLDSLTGGDVDLKASFLNTIINDMPKEVDKIEADLANQNWEVLKQSSHKIKSTCAYIGLTKMADVAKTVEKYAWKQTNLHEINDLVRILAENCKAVIPHLYQELEQLPLIKNN